MRALEAPDIAAGQPCDELTFMEQLRRAINAPTLALPLSGATVRCWRVNCGSVVTRDRAGRTTGRFSAGGMIGAADLTGVASVQIHGVTLGLRLEIETKGTKTPVTPGQVAFAAQINRLGGVAVCVRYSATESLAENVARGVREVDEAIRSRVAGATDPDTR